MAIQRSCKSETILTIRKAAELSGVSENTIYKKLRKGILSRSHTGKGIDLSELLRVYPDLNEPQKGSEGVNRDDVKVTPLDSSQVSSQVDNQVITLLKAQVQDLKDVAVESGRREERLMALLESRLLQDDTVRHEGIVSKIKWW